MFAFDPSELPASIPFRMTGTCELGPPTGVPASSSGRSTATGSPLAVARGASVLGFESRSICFNPVSHGQKKRTPLWQSGVGSMNLQRASQKDTAPTKHDETRRRL